MNHRALLLTPLLWLFALALPKSQPAGCPTANPVLVTNNAASGTNSLRWAIECINAVTPLTTINFSPGASIISLAGSSPLPAITKKNAQINGPVNTTVILDGAGLSVPAHGLTFQTSNAAVRNLSIRNFTFTAAGSGIHFSVDNGLLIENCRLYNNVNGVTAVGSDVGAGANNLTVTGCNIGLNEAGAPAGNSQNGVRLFGASGTALNASIRFSNIAHNGAAGVNTSNNVVADIRNNSMYCNVSGGIVRTGGSQQGAPTINPNSNYNILIGNAQPNSSVQLFVHDNTGCAGNPPCQGRTLLATINAAPINGLWTYTPPAGSLPNQAQITATVTLAANTSVFSTCFTLPDCSALQAGLTPLPPLCFGQSNGTVNSNVSGGQPVFSYLWNNGFITPNLNNVPAGFYSLTVTDNAGCTTEQSVQLTEPPQMTLTTLQNNVSCFGLSDGGIQSFPGGGTPGYNFQWSNGATTQDLDNLPAGTYTLNISDANGCSETQTVVITQPLALSLSVSGMDAPCFGQAGGSAQAMGGGGTPGYSYQWSDGQSGPNAAGLAAGAYTVVLSDQNNCTLIQSVNIAEPPELILSLIGVNPADSAAADGLAYAQYAGSTPPYQLQWSNGATTDSIGGLPPGVYILTVRDANNCAVSETVLLTANACIPLPAYALLAPAQVCNNASFLLQANDLYPSPNVQYIWLLPTGDSLRTAQSFVNVQVSSPAFGGEYRVIRDSLGCLSPPLGGALVQVLTVSGVSAGQDSVICTAGALTLRAQKLTAFQGEWSSLGAATIDNPNAATTIARNLQSGPNRFVYRVATALCPDAASDTVTYFWERPPVLRDDAYTLKRAFDQVVMEVLLNDDLQGLSDTAMLQIGTPTIGDLFFDPAARRFRYTAPEDFRGDVSFRYVVCFPNPVCPVNPPCDTAVVVIRVENLPQVPEGLITDDPGANGRFTLKGTGGYSRIDVRIVNRWGDLVFEDKDYGASPPWTGDYQRSGKALPDGAYFYQITLYSTGLEPQTLVGAVHLFSQKN